MIRAVIFCFAIATLITMICSEVLTNQPCRQSNPEVCEVKQVTTSPCQMAGEVCKIKRGKNSSITIEFSPGFEAKNLKGRAFWANGFLDLPLAGMETNACLTTKCPTVKGETQTYTYNLFLSKSYPTGSYDVKWRIYDEEDDFKECCTIFKIKLLK